jgi:hypothetical protein
VSSLILLRCDETARPVPVEHPIRLRDRLVARWRALDLDDELARGASPDASAPLALRARSAVLPSVRRTLAADLRRLGEEARSGRVSRVRLPVPRRKLLGASAELDALAERLVAPGPVAVRGVAETRLLLYDGTGVLYSDSPADLRPAVTRALHHLEP